MGIVTPTDELIFFQRGCNHQPDENDESLDVGVRQAQLQGQDHPQFSSSLILGVMTKPHGWMEIPGIWKIEISDNNPLLTYPFN